MIQAFRATRLGAIAATLGFRGIREKAITDRHLDFAGAAKRAMGILGPVAVLAGMVWAFHAGDGRQSRRDPMVLRHTVELPEFGVQVTLPATWSVNPSEGKTQFVARDSTTGAVLSAEIAVSDPSRRLAVDIDRILEQQRARLGPERRSSRGLLALGLFDAQWAELFYDGLGNPLRIKTIALRRGNRVLALTCNGGDQAQAACVAAIMPHH
jgi:hypothetical protein